MSSEGSDHAHDGEEVFLVVLADSDFTTKFKGGFMNKNNGILISDVFQGKVSRKLGPTKILSLTQANSAEWLAHLTPEPKVHMIYRQHPFYETRYLSVDLFHLTLFDEMRQELTLICRSLGAKAIRWQGMSEWDTTLDKPDLPKPLIVNMDDYVYLKHMPSWISGVESRLKNWDDKHIFNIVYDQDYNVTDKLLDKAMAKMSIDPQERLTIFPIHEKKSGNAGKAVKKLNYNLFVPQKMAVAVAFFSKEEYMQSNRDYVRSNWTVYHVAAFLRTIDMKRYTDTFLAERVDGKKLLTMIDNYEVINKLKIQSASDFAQLKARIEDLGSVERVDQMDTVTSMVATVQAEIEAQQKKKSAEASRKTSEEKDKKSKTNEQKESATSPKVGKGSAADSLSQVSGNFQVAIVGAGSVGKTSIVNCLKGNKFQEHQSPTVGAQLVQHSLGSINLELWDTAGQASQHKGVLLHTRRADIILVVYDITRRHSFESLETTLSDVINHGIEPWCSMILLGNKYDIADERGTREVTFEDGVLFAKRFGCASFFEVSARTGRNINEALTNAILQVESAKSREESSKRDSIMLKDSGNPKKKGGCCK